jgi:glycosyltransferase involved in cell wall biosynthesis
MPVRNGEETLDSAVSSILEGTHRDLELIAVDDGSTDRTWDKLRSLQRADERVRAFRQEHSGLVAALNHALSKARAPLVARMDADDVSHPDRLRAQLAHMEAHPEVDVCGCRVSLSPAPEPGTGMARYVEWQNTLITHDEMFRDRFIESILTHATAIFRRSALDRVSGWPDPPWAEDIELWFRLFAAGAVFSKVAESLYTWTIHKSSASWNDPRYGKPRIAMCKLHHLQKTFLRGDREVELWGVGRSLERWLETFGKNGISIARARVVAPRSIAPEDLPEPADTKVVAFYVSDRVRNELREAASKRGWREEIDIVFSA